MEKRSSYAFAIMVNNTTAWSQGLKKKREQEKDFKRGQTVNTFERP